jgi:anaphase-promoting complex subunit 4
MFCTLDLLFINQFGEYLHQLAAGSSRLKNLLRYMKDTIVAMHNEWRTMNELPARFLRSLIDDLKEKDSGTDVRTEFLELLCTGLPTEVSQEWLVDILGERGLKRWEKAATTGYENLRKLGQQYLVEAAERLTILLSRSRGLAKWYAERPLARPLLM